MRRRADLLAIALLAALPFLFFWPVIFGGRTLVPLDNLFVWEPWRSLAGHGVGPPHNELLSDLILENYVWKLFIRQSLSFGELPLWNPYLFSGVPFLAAGQHSALYPFGILFHLLPLHRAYGVFSALQLAIAGIGTYLFLRTLTGSRAAALLSGVAYAFSSFMVVSVAFTMMIAAAAWLPWCLLALEMAVRRAEGAGRTAAAPEQEPPAPQGRPREAVPWVALGAAALGLHILAGHVEITYYVLLIMGFYAGLRLLQTGLDRRSLPWRGAVAAASIAAFGLALGAVQLVPLYELVSSNFRAGAAQYEVTYEDVIGWAYPLRQAAAFLVPDVFGNPSIHSYLDITTLRQTPITANALGEAVNEVAWGKGLSSWKNYVEGSAFVGVVPLLLALPALLSRRHRRYVAIFAALAAVSLLFVFGTPLYRLLFLLPGVDQLHTPFRWVFPYTFSVAVLAGLGAAAIVDGRERAAREAARLLGRAAVAGGVLALLGLLLVLVWPAPFVGMAERLLQSSELTRRAFADGGMLLSYHYRNLLLFAAALLGGGVALVAALGGWRRRGVALWQPLAAAVLVAELFAVGYGFNPRADPRLLDEVPPVVRFLQQDGEPWRFTTFIAPGEKPLNANAGMLYGLEDVRGYDSIIPRQYVDFMGLIEEQNELLYNRIAPLSRPESLDSPLLDLLNVKYVVSSLTIDRPGYERVYEGELFVYRNESYMPRAFALTRAERVAPEELGQALRRADPRRAVILEGTPGAEGAEAGALLPVTILQREHNEVLLYASLPQPAWVVLTDAHFPGWRAYVRPAASAEPEAPVEIERAYGAFRAVHLPAGDWELHLKYMPRSFQIGLYGSFLGGVTLLLIVAAWLWSRHYRRDDEERTASRVAKNSLTPMTLSLVNKLIDMAFAMLMLRILAPEGAGRYQFAVAFIGYFEVLIRFGLGTLLTREVARDPGQGPRYLGNALALRGLLWLGSLPLMGLLLLAYLRWGGLTPDVVVAVGLFALAIFLSNINDSISSIFYAHERMEYPAFIATGTTLTRVTLGAAVLLLGGGFIGLAAVSIVSNLVTTVTLMALLARHYFRPRLELDRQFSGEMARQSLPLLINHLLATVFFQVDVLMLQPLRGSVEVGYYGAAYRYIRGLDIIPSYFTLALFPVMSRYAQSARESLQRAYTLSLRLLFMLSLPLAMGTTFIARDLIQLLAGADYLPQSQQALQILVWYMPLGFVNSVTQYVLIALDEQHYLSRAFVIGVGFNIAANLMAIPLYGFAGAAVVTVLSEVALLVPFLRRVYRHLAPPPWADLVWRPLAATAAMGLAMHGLERAGVPVLLIVPAAGAVYAATLLALGAARAQDMDVVLGIFRRRLAAAGNRV